MPWKAITWRALRRFYDHQMTQHAAALTYYAMLSLFPAVLVAVALLGLLGHRETVSDITSYLSGQGAPRAVVVPVRSLLRSAIHAGSGAVSVTLVASLVMSLIGASGAFASVRRALNAAYDVGEARPFVGRKLADVGATLVLIVMAVLILVLVFLGGGVADDLFGALGLGHAAASVWQVARWPAALGVTLLAYAFVYWTAPNISSRRWRTFSPGALVAVPLWLVMSFGFWWYITNLAQLAVYGTFGAAVVLLVWLFLSSAALLLGAELNAALSIAEGRAG